MRPRPTGSKANLTVSELIMKLIFLHGADICLENVETEDGDVISLTVAQLIQYNLSQDELAFSLPIYNKVLSEAAEMAGVTGTEILTHFTQHSDYDISSLAIRLTSDELMKSEEELKQSPQQLFDTADHLLLDFRNEYLNIMMNQLKQEIIAAKDDPEKQRQLIGELQQMQKQRAAIAKRIGSCVR
jgi:DNA primase